MKKLILLLTLLLSLTVSAQSEGRAVKKQFTKNYIEVFTSTTNKWNKCDIRVLYNYGGDESKIKIITETTTRILTQFVETERKVTSDGDEYFELMTKDETGKVVILQYFEELAALRILFFDGSRAILLE